MIADFVRADLAENIMIDVYRLAHEIHPHFPQISRQELIALIDVAIIQVCCVAVFWGDSELRRS